MKHIEVREPENSISLKDVGQAELEMGVKLPEEYRQFLLNANGGHPIKNTFPLLEPIGNNPDHIEGGIAWLSAIYDGKYYNLVKEYNIFKGDRTPEDLLVIADNGGGIKFACASKGLIWARYNGTQKLDS